MDQLEIDPENIQQGQAMQFTLETPGPDLSKIPSKEDLFGATAVILSVSYF